MLSLEQAKRQLADTLVEYRYAHCMRVADTAQAIARRYALDEDKAYWAGLLHDCAKFMDDAQYIALAESLSMPLTPVQRAQPETMLHAALSKHIAQRDYGVEDPDILRAIELHQAGAPDIQPLEMAIALADATEPNRKGMEEIRQLLQSDLLAAYARNYFDTTLRIVQNGYLLDENRAATYNALRLMEWCC